ncbi:MAG TPA: hypothetical protein VJJ76_00360 [archaeon]|nr:hypothetical protein [archaeon]
MALSKSEKVRKFRSMLKKPKIRKFARKLRGFLKECENCGAKRAELFKVYSFTKENEDAHFYCRQCYSRLMAGKKFQDF